MNKLIKSILFLLSLSLATSGASFAQDWVELPEGPSSPGVVVRTARMTSSGKDMRSYTYCYDASLRISLWVAYPLNAALIGQGSRSDGWEVDPLMPRSWQPDLEKGFRYGSGYDRGHQIPSADRLDPKANRQTFRYTNATPQLHDFNGGIWAELEKRIRVWAKQSDTLYVVTGVIPGKHSIKDNAGNPVNIPDAYWKAVLRRSQSKYGGVRWSTCAVLLPHKAVTVGTWQQNSAYFKKNALSIRQLENIIGYELFPAMKEIMGPQTAAITKNADPTENKWWWN